MALLSVRDHFLMTGRVVEVLDNEAEVAKKWGNRNYSALQLKCLTQI